MTNETKVNLSIDAMLDRYNDYIALYHLFNDSKYKTRADEVMNKLREGN